MSSDSAQSLHFIIDDRNNSEAECNCYSRGKGDADVDADTEAEGVGDTHSRGSANNKSNFSVTTPITNDLRRVMLELMSLQNTHRLQKRNLQQWSETDAMSGDTVGGPGGVGAGAACNTFTVTCMDILFTAVSMLMRAVTVVLNIKLAIDYFVQGQQDYFVWTVVCTVVPMFVTTLIYARMCHQDEKFDKGLAKTIQILLIILLSSFFLRYWNSLIYSIKCKRAELRAERDRQVRYYHLTAREDSDLAFIRLFECFMETAPQKILLFSIILMQAQRITIIQILTIGMYFASITFSLGCYNRCIRAAQADKNNLNYQDMLPQLCWHFCITVSRTLCITFVVVLFPVWTIVACLCHTFILGFLTFILERPRFAALPLYNFLFCQAMGIVYLFTYIPVKDAPTRNKYILYYLLCSAENLTCVGLFMSFAPVRLMHSPLLFYGMCAMAITFYYVGIVFMCIYYLHFHPNVTARRSIMYNNH